MIIAIIPAAGESSRMTDAQSGRQLKQLLPFGKSTILESVIQTLLYSKVDKIILVLGYKKNLIEKVVKGYGVEIAVNRDYKQGMLSSIKVGIKRVKRIIGNGSKKKAGSRNGIMIVLGDQPLVDSKVIKTVMKEFNKSKDGILIPVYRKKRGHPILIAESYVEEILGIPLEQGLRKLMIEHADNIKEFPINDSSILKDIDNPEEYKEAMKKRKKK